MTQPLHVTLYNLAGLLPTLYKPYTKPTHHVTSNYRTNNEVYPYQMFQLGCQHQRANFISFSHPFCM